MKKQLFIIGILLSVSIIINAQTTYYVKTDGNDESDGLTWETAKQSIQVATNSSIPGDSVFVKQGHYTLLSELIMKEGVNVYGGFAGTETSLSERPHLIYGKTENDEASILDANADTNNRRRVITQATGFVTETTWDGFVIQNGYPTNGADGGGVYLITKGNINNCCITNNRTSGHGGGIFSQTGGTINNSYIVDNLSGYNGGGIYCAGSGAIITNCIISNNTTSNCGGGILCYSNVKIINCNIINNLSSNSGSGVYFRSGGNITNCILWGNYRSYDISDQIYNYSSVLNITYCAIQNGYLGERNINLEEDNSGTEEGKFYTFFVNPTNFTGKSTNTSDSLELLNADWQINRASVCINGGNNDEYINPNGVLYNYFDIAGEQRITNNIIDIGAYEFHNFTGSEQEQSITWEQDIERVNLIDEILELNAYASSGLPISYISSNTNVLTVTGSHINIVGAGTATITAIQNGNDNYLPAERISKTISVLNNNARLSVIITPNRVLNPVFNNQVFDYSMIIGLDVETITIIADTYDNNASISEDSHIGELYPQLGYNNYVITVIAEDGVTIQDYTITVLKKPIDVTLAILLTSIGEFTPEFAPDITEYYMNVGSDITNLNITAVPNDESSVVTGAGDIEIPYGKRICRIQVKAEDGTTIKTYNLTIERDIIIPTLPSTNGYDIASIVDFGPIGFSDLYLEKSIYVSRFEQGMTISTINDIERIFMKIEHSYIGDLSMVIKCPNGQTCLLKGYNGGNPYTPTNINNVGSIGGGSIQLGFSPDPASNNPCFVTPGIGLYYWFTPSEASSFGNDGPTTSISYGDPCGNINTFQQLNPGEYGSFENFGSLIGCPINGSWKLKIQDNIGSDNGVLFEWGITFAEHVRPNFRTIATLADINISEGELDPEFSSQTFQYNVYVESNIETINISATPTDSYATITGNSNIGEQSLNYGDNEFTITVIAEDRTTSLTYNITINRRPISSDATLSSIIVSEGELTPEFDPQTFQYDVYVESNIETIEISAVTNDNFATIVVNRNTDLYNLNYGINEFIIKVIAEDDETFLNYKITVTRGHTSIENQETSNFIIFPNPAKKQISLNLQEIKETPLVQIINTLGIICYQQELQGGEIHEISIESFAKGVYFVHVNNKIVKLIIE
ncbi:MAG: cadherin-like beta sandwich domain-containing protein [Bacteroidales bacterium]|jgi:subtilisin-like proprotein convertase family protein|nr:cadherin-like beta sandwich domain-containing protein [Bacteroidales bacterium]